MNNTSSPPKSQEENLRLSPYQRAQNHYACDHDETAVRFKTYSNSTLHYFEQCLNCGRAVGSAIPHKDIKDIKDIDVIPFWDGQLENAYQFMIDEMINQIQLEENQRHETFSITRREEYNEYLQTEVWKSKRNRVLRRDQYLCQACLIRPATQVHHKVYPECFGDEPLFDLVSVCKICHNAIHRINGDE